MRFLVLKIAAAVLLTSLAVPAYSADIMYGPRATKHSYLQDCWRVWRCSYGSCGWKRVCMRGCPDRYSCYPLYGAYGPYGGHGYWSAYSWRAD